MSDLCVLAVWDRSPGSKERSMTKSGFRMQATKPGASRSISRLGRISLQASLSFPSCRGSDSSASDGAICLLDDCIQLLLDFSLTSRSEPPPFENPRSGVK